MDKKIENKILKFVDTLKAVYRKEMVHGTLYVALDYDSACDLVHESIRDFYKKEIKIYIIFNILVIRLKQDLEIH